MMNNLRLIGTDLLDESAQFTWDEATSRTRRLLNAIATDEEFLTKATLAFGDGFDTEKLEGLRQQWAAGEFEAFPAIEIRSAAEINGANGAFSADTNMIYLSREYIEQNVVNSQAIANVLLEEIGHSVDSQINVSDAPGDEGAIFSALAQGVQLDEATLQSLKVENDTATITLDGQVIQIEQADSYTGNNLNAVIEGLESLFGAIQSSINSQVFGKNLPIFGTGLNNALTLQDLWKSEVLSGVNLTIDTIAQKLSDATGGVVTIVSQNTDEIKFSLNLNNAKSLKDRLLAANLGIPDIGLDVKGSADANLNLNFNLDFGLNKNSGFFLDTAKSDEFK